MNYFPKPLNIIKPASLFLLLCIAGLNFQSAYGEIAIVVGKNSPIGEMNKKQVVKVFLGKSKSVNGVTVVPMDQVEGTEARNEFYGTLIKKSEAQLKSYWSRLIFTGKGQAPQIAGKDKDVKVLVSKNPNVVGYIDASKVDENVRVIFRFP